MAAGISYSKSLNSGVARSPSSRDRAPRPKEAPSPKKSESREAERQRR